MAGTLTTTSTKRIGDMIVNRYTLTSHTDGSLSNGTVSLSGFLVSVVTNPSATAPTADWDLTILDEDGVDILAGAGADRHTTNSLQVNLMTTGAVPVAGDYTITGANMGSEKIADVVLRIRP